MGIDIFTERVRELRGDRLQREVAEEIGITLQTYGRCAMHNLLITQHKGSEDAKRRAESYKNTGAVLFGLFPCLPFHIFVCR